MKIVYVFSTLAKTGGTERIITEKANYYAEKFGYDITIINCLQHSGDDNHFFLSKKVKQINIGIPFYTQYKYKYPKRLWKKWTLDKQIKKNIERYVQIINPDFLIGISFFYANIVSTIKCRAVKIIECHEAKTFTHSNFNHSRSLLSSLFQEVWRHFYFRTIEQNADIIITLTEGDKLQWKKAKHIEVIPNFSTMPITKYSDGVTKRVISVGRLEKEKGFYRLIDIWKDVVYKHPDWSLDIFGEGKLKDDLENRIKSSKVRNLNLRESTLDISKEYANSSICVVTSYYEGFSLVLLEAMRHGLPCIAFDCPFGPRSIINDNINGFLINDNDTRLYAEKLCLLIENENLRKKFSKAAIEKSSSFDTESIMQRWKNLFEQVSAE